MRTVQIAPLHEAAPARFYDHTERLVSCLTLVEQSVDVKQFASGNSRISTPPVAAWPLAPRLNPTIRDLLYPLIA